MQLTSIKRIQDNAQLGGKSSPLGIVQVIKFWSCRQMVYVQTRICPRKWAAKILWIFEIQMDFQILARRPDFVSIYKKKWTSRKEDFPSQVNRRVKMKEDEKIDKYLNLVRELKIIG